MKARIHEMFAGLEPAERTILKLASAIAVLLLFVAALGIALGAESNANHARTSAQTANDRAQAACQLYKTVAEAPISPKSTPLGISIAVGARVAYANAKCNLGTLKPPDPRVSLLLPPELR